MKLAFKITVEGNDITALVADRLLSCEITDQAGVKSDRFSMVLDDRDQRLELPKTGAKIEVFLGYVGQALVKMGQYTVDEVDVSGPAREMSIRANAVDMTGSIRAPKERSWDKITLGDLVNTIAKDNGLKPAVASALASRQLGHVDQTESDMQLLQRICADNGATCKVADGRLIVAERAAGKTTDGKELPPVTISAGDCESWHAVLAKRNQYKSVLAYWQNVNKARRTGVTVGSGVPRLTMKNTYATQEEARQAAESRLNAMNRGGGKVSISGLIGNPSMCAEQTATLTGFRDGIDGDDWLVNSVTHSFSSSGYTCSLELESKE